MSREVLPDGTHFDGRDYQARFDAIAAQGVDVHGEATLVDSYGPRRVLDAGCGTGRVAAELARRGVAVVGVDVDESMLEEARRREPSLTWILCDLASMSLGEAFDLVVLAGNVPLFCPPERRIDLVTRCAQHVEEAGRMVAGFELRRGLDLPDYDRACQEAGLRLEDRWSTWDRAPFDEEDGYAVSVHVRESSPPT